MLIESNELISIINGTDELINWQKELFIEYVEACDEVKQPQWIPCSERLPDKSGSYLIWYLDGFGNKDYYVLYWDDGRKGFYPKWKENPSRHELAWMELPKRYIKEESK